MRYILRHVFLFLSNVPSRKFEVARVAHVIVLSVELACLHSCGLSALESAFLRGALVP